MISDFTQLPVREDEVEEKKENSENLFLASKLAFLTSGSLDTREGKDELVKKLNRLA
jgi:hypothetical protein